MYTHTALRGHKLPSTALSQMYRNGVLTSSNICYITGTSRNQGIKTTLICKMINYVLNDKSRFRLYVAT